MRTKLFKVVCFLYCAGYLLTSAGCEVLSYEPAYRYCPSTPLILQTTAMPAHADYLSAEIGNPPPQHELEKTFFARLRYTAVVTRRYTNLNYGAFAFGGTYQVNEPSLGSLNGNKSFGGGGLEAGACLNIPIGRFKIGAGFNLALVGEFGSFTSFRETASSRGLIDAPALNKLELLPAVFPLFAYEFDDASLLSLQANLGLPGWLTPSLSYLSGDYVYILSYFPTGATYTNQIYSAGTITFGLRVNTKKIW